MRDGVLAFVFVYRSHIGKFAADVRHQIDDFGGTFVSGVRLERLTERRAGHGSRARWAPHDTMRDLAPDRCVGGLLLLIQATFRIGQEGIQQIRIVLLHDVTQSIEYVAIHMWVSHLFTP